MSFNVEIATKQELVDQCKKYKFVLMKLHNELETKDEEIRKLYQLINKLQKK